MNNINFNRNTDNPIPQRKKIDIKQLKNNTIHSLYEVECFLINFNEFKKYIKLYKVLK